MQLPSRKIVVLFWGRMISDLNNGSVKIHFLWPLISTLEVLLFFKLIVRQELVFFSFLFKPLSAHAFQIFLIKDCLRSLGDFRGKQTYLILEYVLTAISLKVCGVGGYGLCTPWFAEWYQRQHYWSQCPAWLKVTLARSGRLVCSVPYNLHSGHRSLPENTKNPQLLWAWADIIVDDSLPICCWTEEYQRTLFNPIQQHFETRW